MSGTNRNWSTLHLGQARVRCYASLKLRPRCVKECLGKRGQVDWKSPLNNTVDSPVRPRTSEHVVEDFSVRAQPMIPRHFLFFRIRSERARPFSTIAA